MKCKSMLTDRQTLQDGKTGLKKKMNRNDFASQSILDVMNVAIAEFPPKARNIKRSPASLLCLPYLKNKKMQFTNEQECFYLCYLQTSP